MDRFIVTEGKRVRFVGPSGVAPLTTDKERHLLTGCVGTIVIGVSNDVWCYPDDQSLDMVWVVFEDDIRPIRQVSFAWLELL
jgi:hypothetical protein